MQNTRSCTAARTILHCTMAAYIEAYIPAFAGERIREMLVSIIRFLHAWKRYGVAVQELSNLNDRELADIGITRSDIPRLAWEHAQG
jgi:uncharacterized protein YjiS (DUF1127 family)